MASEKKEEKDLDSKNEISQDSEKIEDETYITVNHPMTKEHYISFIAVVGTDGFSLKKLYPEGSCEARFRLRGHGKIYCYCNHHGMSSKKY